MLTYSGHRRSGPKNLKIVLGMGGWMGIITALDKLLSDGIPGAKKKYDSLLHGYVFDV